jgi:hypothetical protein
MPTPAHRPRRAGPDHPADRGEVGLCPATGKLQFASRATARAFARRLSRGPDHRPRPGAGPLEAYCCAAAACGLWHVGHRPARRTAGGDGSQAAHTAILGGLGGGPV